MINYNSLLNNPVDYDNIDAMVTRLHALSALSDTINSEKEKLTCRISALVQIRNMDVIKLRLPSQDVIDIASDRLQFVNEFERTIRIKITNGSACKYVNVHIDMRNMIDGVVDGTIVSHIVH